ncbi:hypothetical protein Egran_04421 [Elaphomyces granulatus]|uniref:Glycosyl transferase family 1 domain-containing protein n=1 Tax=Elaphomyces granulatus TaxID=519963 RepID=A0A232LUW0_9EURO|nr:hypothetical protein Egran_04421 [Elaphomyces granulatus]
MANILYVHPLGWQGMNSHSWQWVLIGLVLAALSVGSIYTSFLIVSGFFTFWKSRKPLETIPRTIASRLDVLSKLRLELSTDRLPGEKPSSFGVYLGSFQVPPTEDQSKITEQWDLLVLDPFREGVREAVDSFHGKQVLGRLSLSLITSKDSTVRAFDKIESALTTAFSRTAFNGLLLAEWEGIFNSPVLMALIEVIRRLGLIVYLETGPPDFLQDRNMLQADAISGLVIRNASILGNGEKRDYFQMTNLRDTIKAFVSEACLRDFVVMAWETVDDHITPSNAVIRRGMQWCNFYSVISWIGSESALTNASANVDTCEPLSAFGWLKEAEVMKVHDVWRSNGSILSQAPNRPEWKTLASFFPSLDSMLASAERVPMQECSQRSTLRDPPDWVAQSKSHGNPLSLSLSGTEYGSLGCFPLGSEISTAVFSEILQSQRRLKSLGLLHPVAAPQLQSLGELLGRFHDNFLSSNWPDAPQAVASVKELSTLASENLLRVHLGLDSGFRKTADIRSWAVYQTDGDAIEIFTSKNAKGLVGTVLHTFLSSKGFPRHLCFEAETALAKWSMDLMEDTGLPRRLVQDIDMLTPGECLLQLQHLTLADTKTELSNTICSYLRKKLIEAPSLSQLKELNTVGYLGGKIAPETLIESRIKWYRDQDCQYPSPSTSVAFFQEAEDVLFSILRCRRESDLATISTAISNLLQPGKIDAYSDMIALALFCASRKGAFDEIYAEVTDRNPLFNNQSDQAAAFAESFALGSRCEAYFDISPSVFGKLLSNRFRSYYNKHHPPSWVNGAPELATAYAGAQIDVNPDDKVKPMPGYQTFTFLSVFSIPALIDIVLLTFIGRGLYLSAFMTVDEQQSATTALMISLLLSGAIGTWISCGGSYYLISMAFSAMNMFILIRIIAGLSFTIAGGLIGFVAFSIAKGPRAGVVFYLYLVALTAYLTLFATIASFSFPGTGFLSGRKIIIACIPVLFISPIITTFVGHDSVVYLVVLYFFVGLLVLGLRSVGSQWVTWYQKIRKTSDTEIRQWYISTYAGNNEKALENMSDPAALKLSRDALMAAVLSEKRKRIFSKATTDKLVFELARDWDATNFLLNWYSRYADIPRAIPFSSTWNIQTKVALDTLQNAQKGIRLHNSFILWRQAGAEVGCGFLFFLVALIDKWIELLCGGNLIGLSASTADASRMAVGLGLAYYLVGAVLIDTMAQHLHELLSRHPPVAVKSAKEIRGFQKREVRIKRQVYWATLFRCLLSHLWTLAITASLIWAFQESLQGIIIFCSYVLAYTGLLWYQYTKIFCGPHALKPLLASLVIGLPIGFSLRLLRPDFAYSGVITLGVTTWTLALLCLWSAKIGMPKKVESPVELGRSFHAYMAPWSDPEWSQQELQTMYEGLLSVSRGSRLIISPRDQLGLDIKSVLLSRKTEPRILEAFPGSENLVKWAIEAWEKGNLSIEILHREKLCPGIRALSCTSNDQLRLLIGVNRQPNQALDIRGNIQVIAETLVHAAAEGFLHIPHEYAMLSESLVAAGVTETLARELREESDTSVIIRWAKKELLRQLCLGFQCDVDWEVLPREIRTLLLDRCLGQTCETSDQQHQWLQQSLCRFDTDDLHVHVARCNLGAAVAVSVLDYAHLGPDENIPSKKAELTNYVFEFPARTLLLKRAFYYVYNKIGSFNKYLVTALVADGEFQREFNHVMKDRPRFIRVPIVLLFNAIWMYSKVSQEFFLKFFLFHGRANVEQLWNETKGMTVNVKRDRAIVQGLDGTFTAFKHMDSNGTFKMYQYAGEHKSEPKDSKGLQFINTYSKKMLLLIREEFEKGEVINEYHYDYRDPSKKGFKLSREANPKIPLGRRCVRGKNYLQSILYNRKGLIAAGSYIKDGNLVRFKYHYRKNPRTGDELLRAEFVLSHMSCTVSWCAPPRRHPEKVERWIPHSKITEATFVQGPDVYECRWLYDHKFHPTIFTSLNGQKVQTPPMIEFDYLGVLTKPKNTSFIHDNPLFYYDSLSTNIISRLLVLNKRRFPVSTSRARSMIWKAWKQRADFDGVIVQWMDERLLRQDKVLAPYWRSRNLGDLLSAKKYFELRADAIMASADLDDSISSWTALAVRMGDLLNFGPGGDAILFTRSKDFGFDNDNKLHVLASDNGTWPNEGGGVSACRRDMINSLRTIKWHMVCESAHDFGTPKHQTEQNVQSLKMIALWGLDFLTPTHGLFKNKLDSEVDSHITSATEVDIKMNFIPILTALVKGARAVRISTADIQQATRALVNLNTYFDSFRHWSQVWTSEVVKESWRELWLTQEMPNATPSSEWFETELPTLGHMDTALDLWFRYLFIFSIPLPEKLPAVFQASHHSASASYGVICKLKRKCTLQIWDHAISWRETNLCLSSALCKLSPFVRNSLLGLLRLTSILVLHHADIVSPCADFFNPGWEVEIGTCEGTLEHRNLFRRKVDPVVNGITDMQKFVPVKEIKSQRPTVTMLSHVWYAKDIKIAILAADIVINRWKFDEYHLDIYGAIDKAPTYSTECQELIASKGLRGRVTLRGTADPMKVLENTWLFLNSSLSEGLPLALGEAALTGAPVVCTDVGASLRVLSDPDDFSRFSAVVAPNDALALARAQIQMLALLGEWSKYADDTGPAPVLTSSPTPEEVSIITQRMYDKTDQRRKLGMMTRAIVQKSFSGARYLREHEQMLWVGKSFKTITSRTAGDFVERFGSPADIQETATAMEGEFNTIPQSLIASWRSSTSSGASSFFTTPSRMSMLDETRSLRSNPYESRRNSIDVETGPRPTSRSYFPVFAPRHSDILAPGAAPSEKQVSSDAGTPVERDLSKGLRREELPQYRNSDVSAIMREEFWNWNSQRNEPSSKSSSQSSSLRSGGNSRASTEKTTPKVSEEIHQRSIADIVEKQITDFVVTTSTTTTQSRL